MKTKSALLKIFLIAILSIFFCTSQIKDNEKVLLPIDDSLKDSSFNIFKEQLLLTLKKRNVTKIKAILANNVIFGFSPDAFGKKAFEKYWLVPNVLDKFCNEMVHIIHLGCTKEIEDDLVYFACPYVYSRFPQNMDEFEWYAVIGNNISIYMDSFTTSKKMGRLSYNLIKKDNIGSTKWCFVPATKDHASGYIERKFVYSPSGFRVIFRKEKGKWLLFSFIAGD